MDFRTWISGFVTIFNFLSLAGFVILAYLLVFVLSAVIWWIKEGVLWIWNEIWLIFNKKKY